MRPIVIVILSLLLFATLFTAISQHGSMMLFSKSLMAEQHQDDKSLTENSSSPQLDPGKYVPYSCRDHLGRVKNRTLGVKDPNAGVMIARQQTASPSFWMSVHNQSFDGSRWCLYVWGRYYEKQLMAAFDTVVRAAPPGSRVIDVGANIGYFSMLSASLGPVTVDSFEPNPKNRLRYCESASLNHWYGEFEAKVYEPQKYSYVNLYSFGIGKEEGYFSFRESSNPGQGSFGGKATAGQGLQIITLDNLAKERGWFESRPHIVLLKVDVEGFELKVFQGAIELMKSKIVENIFNELSARGPEEVKEAKAIVKLILDSGYKIHNHGGWMGPHKPCTWPHDETLPDRVVAETVQHGAKQLNLWWKVAKPVATAQVK